MAVRTSSFEIAAVDADVTAPDADENVVEIKLGKIGFTLWRRPSAGQFATLQLRLTRRRDTGDQAYHAVDRFLDSLMLARPDILDSGRKDEDGVEYEKRLDDGESLISADDLWDMYADGAISVEQILGLVRMALEEHSGFPTESLPVSSPGPTKSGPPSTAASRRNRSTPSA